MPNITEVTNYDESVPAIQDLVTTLDAAGLNPIAQVLADRTNYLKSVTDGITATLLTLRAAAFLIVGTIAGTVAAGDHGHSNTSNIGGPYAPAGTLESAFPAGSIYFNATDNTNPNVLFGFGTWTAIGVGQMLLSAGTGYTAGSMGGEATHTLVTGEMPAHTHSTLLQEVSWVDHANGGAGADAAGTDVGPTQSTGSTGGGAAHNNMPPYLAVYIWQRVA